jgi:hypothetical protein
MDIVFISKLLIIGALYYLTNCIYKKVDWHSRGQKVWTTKTVKNIDKFLTSNFNTTLETVLIFMWVVIYGLPLMYSVIGLGFVILFQGFFELLDTKGYWEQVLICFGVISLMFSIRVYLDGERKKILEKDGIIEYQRKRIYELETQIKVGNSLT